MNRSSPVKPVFATEIYVNHDERQTIPVVEDANNYSTTPNNNDDHNNDDGDIIALREPLLSTTAHADIHVEPGTWRSKMDWGMGKGADSDTGVPLH
jgi:hypothetical protein